VKYFWTRFLTISLVPLIRHFFFHAVVNFFLISFHCVSDCRKSPPVPAAFKKAMLQSSARCAKIKNTSKHYILAVEFIKSLRWSPRACYVLYDSVVISQSPLFIHVGSAWMIQGKLIPAHCDFEIGKVKFLDRNIAITTMLVVPLHHVWLMVAAAGWVLAPTGVLDVYNCHCDQKYPGAYFKSHTM